MDLLFWIYSYLFVVLNTLKGQTGFSAAGWYVCFFNKFAVSQDRLWHPLRITHWKFPRWKRRAKWRRLLRLTRGTCFADLLNVSFLFLQSGTLNQPPARNNSIKVPGRTRFKGPLLTRDSWLQSADWKADKSVPQNVFPEQLELPSLLNNKYLHFMHFSFSFFFFYYLNLEANILFFILLHLMWQSTPMLRFASPTFLYLKKRGVTSANHTHRRMWVCLCCRWHSPANLQIIIETYFTN